MKSFLKKNISLVLAFVLPIGLIIVIALSTYLPSFFLSTDYNFIYSSYPDGTSYYPYPCDKQLQQYYSVVKDKLVVVDATPIQGGDKNEMPCTNDTSLARLFLHDTHKNESREITLEEAQKLTLSGLLSSPDGVTVSSHYDRGGDFFFFFGGGSSYGNYLTRGKNQVRLNLVNQDDRYFYQNNFQFIGWVLPGRNQ